MELLSKLSHYPPLANPISNHWNVSFHRWNAALDDLFLLNYGSEAEIIPPTSGFHGNETLIAIHDGSDRVKLYLWGMLNSVVMRYLREAEYLSLYQLPIPRLNRGNRYFDGIMARSALLICTEPTFAPLWQSAVGSDWREAMDSYEGDLDLADERNQLDALVAHLYTLTRDEYAQALNTTPSRKESALATYDEFAALITHWQRDFHRTG